MLPGVIPITIKSFINMTLKNAITILIIKCSLKYHAIMSKSVDDLKTKLYRAVI